MEILLVIFASLVLSVFFPGMEIAFISADKPSVKPDKTTRSVSSRALKFFTGNFRPYLVTMRLGKYICLVAFGLLFFHQTETLFYSVIRSNLAVTLIQILFAAPVILITSELIPRFLFRYHANAIILVGSIPLFLFHCLLYPLSWLIVRLSGIVETIPAYKNNDHNQFSFGKINSEHLIHQEQDIVTPQHTGNIDNEVKLFRNALDFSKVKLREIMIPRTEIAALDVHSGFDELRQKFIETGYSRILFYRDNIDNIVGYIHHSTIFSRPESIHSAMKAVLIVPETMSASKLLSTFIQEHRSIAIIVDEFGGTSGMVTSEDILEEIFGEIEDEHDIVDWVEKQMSEDEYIFSARIDLDILNEKYDLGFPPNENYETLAGYILFHYESIPRINAVITIGKYRFKILKATSTRIEMVNLKILPEQK